VEFISKSKIKICREISDLDSFTLDFLKILEKHSKYVVISGYVAISLLPNYRCLSFSPTCKLILFPYLLFEYDKMLRKRVIFINPSCFIL